MLKLLQRFIFSKFMLCTSSCRSRTAVAPLERLKILLQVGHLYLISLFSTYCFAFSSYNCCIKLALYWTTLSFIFHFSQWENIMNSWSWKMQVQNPHSIQYNGTIQGLKYIWRTEGFRGLFKGNGTNCARIVPNSAVKFFSYEEASKYVLLSLFFFKLGFLIDFQCHSDFWPLEANWLALEQYIMFEVNTFCFILFIVVIIFWYTSTNNATDSWTPSAFWVEGDIYQLKIS